MATRDRESRGSDETQAPALEDGAPSGEASLALAAPLLAFLEEAEGALRELRDYERARLSRESEED